MFTDIIPTMYVEAQKWEFWVFLPAKNQNQLKINTFTCFELCGGWRCQQPTWRVPPTTLGWVFPYTILYKLWTHRGVITSLLHFYIVDPVGTVTAWDNVNSQTCRKWGNVWNLGKLHNLVEISFVFLSTLKDIGLAAEREWRKLLKVQESGSRTEQCVEDISEQNNAWNLKLQNNYHMIFFLKMQKNMSASHFSWTLLILLHVCVQCYKLNIYRLNDRCDQVM